MGRKSSVSTAGYAQGADGEEEFGDDFDDFEEGEEDADFGDFDDGFQEPVAAAPQPVPVTPSFVSRNLGIQCIILTVFFSLSLTSRTSILKKIYEALQIHI